MIDGWKNVPVEPRSGKRDLVVFGSLFHLGAFLHVLERNDVWNAICTSGVNWNHCFNQLSYLNRTFPGKDKSDQALFYHYHYAALQTNNGVYKNEVFFLWKIAYSNYSGSLILKDDPWVYDPWIIDAVTTVIFDFISSHRHRVWYKIYNILY